jgi:hypothetical protein
VKRDEVRRPRASSQRGTRAAAELLPGPLGVPARSWLKARPAHSSVTDRTKARPAAEKTPRLARREAPACRKARAIRILRFSARHPPFTPRTLPASRQGTRMPCSSATADSIPPLDGGEVQPPRNRRFPGFFLWPRRNQPKFEQLFMLAEQDVMGHVRERHGDSSPGAAFRLARGS